MPTLPWLLTWIPVAIVGYAYIGYPVVLWAVGRWRPAPRRWVAPELWPKLTITIPCYNEALSIGATVESILALDYPEDRREILVISDASTDGTDAIVQSYRDRGVELLRLPKRSGKTAAENAAAPRIRGEIVVNTDATIRILPGALKALVSVFQDPTIGVASGRDVSVGNTQSAGNQGESRYVGYEMWVRALETRVGTIVGASGCFFAIRTELYDGSFPETLSRDFASCLIARERGYRSVSVDDAMALVPRARSLRAEYHRKIRTLARGLGTLHFKRHLLNPKRFGTFALMLFSHKLCRWLVQLSLPLLAGGVILLAVSSRWAVSWVIGGALASISVMAAAWFWPEDRPMPGLLSVPGYFLWSNVAGLVAWTRFFRRKHQPVWEPTRRPEIGAGR
jgi:cellulose synthase/poly-beta-1,6-N-acetylglucosamine synthase-like glycosyltransferase